MLDAACGALIEMLNRGYSAALMNLSCTLEVCVLRTFFPKDDQHVLLVIDQFEELFTHSVEAQHVADPTSSTASACITQQTQFVERLAAVSHTR